MIITDQSLSHKYRWKVLNKILEGGMLKKVVLAHLSEECNTEEIAVDTVLSKIDCEELPEIYVAKQREALPIIEVSKWI